MCWYIFLKCDIVYKTFYKTNNIFVVKCRSFLLWIKALKPIYFENNVSNSKTFYDPPDDFNLSLKDVIYGY